MLSFFLGLSIASAEPKIVESNVILTDSINKHLVAEANEFLEFSYIDWWQTIPIWRQFAGFQSWSEDKIERDLHNLKLFFQNQGYRTVRIQATVSHFEPDLLHNVPRRITEPVTISYSVELGPVWMIEEILFHDMPSELNIDEAQYNNIRYSLEVKEEIEEEVQEYFLKEGYVNSALRWQSRILEPGRIRLEAVVERNQPFDFGVIHFQDWSGLDIKPLFPELKWYGQQYNRSQIDDLQKKLNDLEQFETVEIMEEPLLSENKIDLYVQVQRQQRWSKGMLFSVASEATTWAADTGVYWDFHSTNASLHGEHRIGYRNFPILSRIDFSHQGFMTKQSLEVTRMLSAASATEAFWATEANFDSQIGYQQASLISEIGLRWRPISRFWLATIVDVQRHQFYPMLYKQELFDEWFGVNGLESNIVQPEIRLRAQYFDPEYSLFQLDIVPFALVNDVPLSSMQIQMEDRRYFGRWSSRNRVQAGTIFWHEEAVNSLQNRYFLGGAANLRGWSYRRVRPPGDPGQVFDLSIGGERMFFASTEWQYQIYPRYQMLVFLDIGQLWTDPAGSFSIQPLLPSLGVGAIFPTMVGDLVMAPAWQLRENELPNPPPRFVNHVYFVPKLRRPK